jgi:hypothetical protein
MKTSIVLSNCCLYAKKYEGEGGVNVGGYVQQYHVLVCLSTLHLVLPFMSPTCVSTNSSFLAVPYIG